MTGQEQSTTVGQLSTPTNGDSRVPATLTRLVWVLWIVSLGVLAVRFRGGGGWEIAGLVAVDGLTAVMWVTVTFFSGIVHSYSRRYLAGSRTIDRFFGRVFAFTLAVMLLVAADHLALFGLAWLAMGLLMADLIGHVEGWPQAQAAASLARRYFLASSALLTIALAALWWDTGATTVSGLASSVAGASSTVVLLAAGALILAAMVQSALVPFHTWLLASMTGPTPASPLMHAGFVNAGGVLLVRFAPVVTADAGVMLAIVLVGAASALLGKLLRTVQTDVKGKLGCSTVGQMGFMIMQAGLGFFGAAITHLILHGFYKAYQFLSSGGEVAHESPTKTKVKQSGSVGLVGVAVIVLTALAGGAVFAGLTGKGTQLDSGVLLVGLVVLTVMHATRDVVTQTSLPTLVRYGAVPLVALPAIAIYATVYGVIEGLLSGLPAIGQPAELTLAYGLVGAAFLAVYLAIETGVYRRSQRLYVALLNATQPPTDTLLTTTEDYNEY
ncbi:oxidoreductase [Halobellus sp. Atlit-38R]|uniref:proton-conducting transporter transmembrane domain-containing protein n=1 Tax=Halobellus sp. Atlit-38R TaxID=2282131 RepID=UPI000EF20EC1|nr:proton-conducting transporter membrane subunit [Halobellus sp. Atlit-38R]RLM88830.1 oxidoreductase [Halobellus sp. Atlit-38R]